MAARRGKWCEKKYSPYQSSSLYQTRQSRRVVRVGGYGCYYANVAVTDDRDAPLKVGVSYLFKLSSGFFPL